MAGTLWAGGAENADDGRLGDAGELLDPVPGHPSGARQLFDLMTRGSWAHMTARWTWNMGGDDPGPGSALLLPAPDLPVLAKALAELAEPMPARSG